MITVDKVAFKEHTNLVICHDNKDFMTIETDEHLVPVFVKLIHEIYGLGKIDMRKSIQEPVLN